MWIRACFLVLALLIVPVAAGASPQSPATVRPQLRLCDNAPLTLRGTHFRRRELVKVTVTIGTRTLVRQARAGFTGVFTVAFPGLRYDPCGTPPEITARGGLSGRVYGIGPRPDCAMP